MKSENKLEGTLREYLREIYEIYVGSNFTEGSFYGSLKHLTEESARILGYSISALTLPKKIEAGYPDLFVRKADGLVGYIEAKAPHKDLEDF